MAEGELTPFGRLMKEGMEKTGLSQGRVGGLISNFREGPVFDATGVRLIMEGKRRLNHELVSKIIDVLQLDPLPAWEAAGLWPPGLSADDLSETLAIRSMTAAGRVARSPEGARSAAPSLSSDQGDSTTATLFTSPPQRAAA